VDGISGTFTITGLNLVGSGANTGLYFAGDTNYFILNITKSTFTTLDMGVFAFGTVPGSVYISNNTFTDCGVCMKIILANNETKINYLIEQYAYQIWYDRSVCSQQYYI
jgi:hypothetical protein